MIYENIDTHLVQEVMGMKSAEVRKSFIKEYLESLTLTVPIKEKGRQGETYKLLLNENFSYCIDGMGIIEIANRNMIFEISEHKLYKVVNVRYNPSQIVSRLMTGNLYHCLMILESDDIEKYGGFLDYSKRITIEDELEARIRSHKEFSHLNIGIHPILDVNKTERQLFVTFKGMNEHVTIGNESSKKLLIGVFIKNEPYGLNHARFSLGKNQDILTSIVTDYFTSFFENGVKVVQLYEEANQYG